MSGKLTPKQRAFLKAYSAQLGCVSRACRKSKTGRSTVYDWMKPDKPDTFRLKMAEIDSDHLDLAEFKLLKLVKKGHFLAIKFSLETKGRKRGFGRHEEIDVNTTNGFTEEESNQMRENVRSQNTLEVAEHRHVAGLSAPDQKAYWDQKMAAIDDTDAFAINRIERQIHKQKFFNQKYGHLRKQEKPVDRFKAGVDAHNRTDN